MRYYTIGLLCLLLLSMSCESDSATYEIGEDFVDNNLKVKLVDTLTLNSSTIVFDSIVTSGTERILLGTVNDDDLGSITSKSFFQVGNNTIAIDDDATYDSIALVLYYDTYYYGDTTKIQTFNVHRINETFEPNNDDEDDEDANFYNSSSLTYDDDALGSLSFYPKPIDAEHDSIYIKLSNEFGLDLFDKIQNDEIEDNDDFTDYLKGIAVIPDNNNSAFLGFSFSAEATFNNSAIRLYYTIKDDDDENNDYYKEFYITSTANQFNNISYDKENSILNGIVDSESSLSSSETNNSTFIQSGTGICTKIEISNLKELLRLEENSTLLEAILKIVPNKSSYNSKTKLSESIIAYVIDSKNRYVSQLLDSDSNTLYATLQNEDDEFNNNTYYTLDLTSFVESTVTTDYDNNYSIMLLLPDSDKTLDKLKLDDFSSSENTKMELAITYLTY